jgi:hypothetical protein
VGLLHSKLKEFLNLEQGNHNVFNYTRQFNTLAQYGTYHFDTDEKKANMYRAIPAAIAAVEPCPYSTAVVGCHHAITAVSRINFPCFNCEKIDHFAQECRLPKQSNLSWAPTPVVNQQRGH